MSNPVLTRRRLGRTGFQVSPLGLGGAHLGRTPDGFDDDLAIRTVHAALEAGINLIDTAPMYWGSEGRVGMALEQWYDDARRREAIVLSTKTGRDAEGGSDFSAEGTKRSVEASLHHLRTDYLDIVLVHDPADVSSVFGPGGTLEALRQFRHQRVIHAIGVGVRSHEFHRHCIESGDFDVCLPFCDFNLLDQSAREGVIEIAERHDVGVLNGAAVMLGLLSGADPRTIAPKLGSFATPERTRRAYEIWQWARSRGIGLPALNLQLCTREQRIASTLVGVANPAELEADILALSEPISDETWIELEAHFGIR